MRKLAPFVVLSLAALATGNVLAADAASDFRVVVPVPGRTAQGISVYLNPAQLPVGTVGQAYAGFAFNTMLQVLNDATFNGTGVSWRISAGSLPAGLTLNSAGQLSGTPTVSTGTNIQFEVAATYKKRTARQTYILDVQASQTDGNAGGSSTGGSSTGGSSTGGSSTGGSSTGGSSTGGSEPPAPEVDNTTPPAPATTTGTAAITESNAKLTVSPTSLSFGDVARLIPTEPLNVTVSNLGPDEAPISIISPGYQDFKVTSSCPASLPAGASCQLSVVFKPLNQGELRDSVSVSMGGKSVPVGLRGTGHHSEARLDYAIPLVNNTLDMGIVALGQFRQSKALTITNTSAHYALALFDAQASSPFTVAHDCGPTLLPAQACTVSLTYSPTVERLDTDYLTLLTNTRSGYVFHYLRGRGAGDLTVSRLSASAALLPGQGSLYLYGTGFVPDSKVYFGDTEATTKFNSGNGIFAIVPPVSAPATSVVTVVNPDGAVASAATPFARVKSLASFEGSNPRVLGPLPVGATSQWTFINFVNKSQFPNESFALEDVAIQGPFEIDMSNSTCRPGHSLAYGGGACNVRLRFKPTTAGAHTGRLSITGGGDVVSLSLAANALAWAGTPSGSGTANTDIIYEHTLSGNAQVGGGAVTKTAGFFLRNTDPSAQVSAAFKLEKGTVFKLERAVKSNGAPNGWSYAGCSVDSATQSTTVCTADAGSGAYPHMDIRLTMTSAPGPGTYTDAVLVLNNAGKELFRVPFTLDVVYNVTAELSSTMDSASPLTEVTVTNAKLGLVGYKDIYLRNVGTNGMLLSSAKLLNATPDVYLDNSSLYASMAVNQTYNLRACGAQLVSPTEITNCLSDDIAGGTYPHQRVRLVYKPGVQGTLTSTLQLTHSGPGVNPIEIPVIVSTALSTQAFSALSPPNAITPVPTIRVGDNYAVDGSNAAIAQNVYLVQTGGEGNLHGYLQLEGGTATQYELANLQTIYQNGYTGNNCVGSAAWSSLCTGESVFKHYQAVLKLYPRLGAGEHKFTLNYLDANKKVVTTTPITVQVANDSKAELSSSADHTVAIANNQVDFGTATLATAPGQASTSKEKDVYLRNYNTRTKLKVTRALIEGGDGSFTFTFSRIARAYRSDTTQACGYKKVSEQEWTDCVTDTGLYNHVKVPLLYRPTAAGSQEAVLKLWHTSPNAPNPIVLPLRGNGVSNQVAGALYPYASSTTLLTDISMQASGANTERHGTVYVKSADRYGAVYADISLEGAPNFTLHSVSSAASNSYTGSCGAVTADLRSGTCLARNLDDLDNRSQVQILVRCKTTDIGTYTGQLRIKTQGKEHLLPLSCTRTS